MTAWLADAALAARWVHGGLSLRAAELSSALCHAFRKILQRCGVSGERADLREQPIQRPHAGSVSSKLKRFLR